MNRESGAVGIAAASANAHTLAHEAVSWAMSSSIRRAGLKPFLQAALQL